MSRVASVYLSKTERERFMQVCEKESCTPYSLVKKTVLDHIWAYPLEKNSPAESEDVRPDLGKNMKTIINDAPEPENSKIEAEAVSERVRKILKGNVE